MLSRQNVLANPISQFKTWYQAAIEQEVLFLRVIADTVVSPRAMVVHEVHAAAALVAMVDAGGKL